MIWPQDAAVLAYTKLRTRRVRHTVLIIISSILFIAISSILFIVSGTLKSIEGYMKSGFASRYVVSALQTYQEDVYSNKEIIARAKELQKELIRQKIADAKKLDINYEQSSEPLLVNTLNIGTENKERLTDLTYPTVLQAITEYYRKNPVNNEANLKKLAEGYSLSKIYKQIPLKNISSNYYLRILSNGKETYDTSTSELYDSSSLAGFSQSYTLMSGDLLKPFELTGQSLEIGDDGSIPIFIQYSVARKLLNIKDLEKNAKTKQKAEYYKELRAKSAGFTFDVCYRNSTSEAAIQDALREGQEYKANMNKKDYVKPELVHDLPDVACGSAAILRDSRTSDQKKYESKVLEFEQKYGKQPEEQKILKFRVVGLMPDSAGSAFSFQQLLQGILSSSISNGWVSPIEILDKQPLINKLASANVLQEGSSNYIELSSYDSAKRFITEKSCNVDYTSASIDPANPYKKCNDEGKYYTLAPFGGNAIAINEFKTNFYKIFNYIILVLVVFASIILLGVVSRVIADSRRETAVFRAIGAKRLDIVQIYVTYVFMIGAIITLITVCSGVLVGQYLQNKYGAEMSIASNVIFNVFDNSDKVFKVYRLMPKDLIMVVSTIFVSCLLSVLIPIISNVRRNPISDMRDER
jgi:ABC-type antimicrobial peptide transport system permease subunit